LELSWLEQPRLCSVWEHRTVRWCTRQCPVRQAGSSELAALGNSPATYGYNSPDCPVSQRSAGPTVGRAIYAGHVAEPTLEGGTGLSGVHRTCPVRQRLPNLQRSASPFKERNRAPDTVRYAPDCPVRQSTEGKISLPRMLSTAPCCLGAIKGTPRRMEEDTKHSYNISKHQDLESAHLFHCDSI
jgi:hypothetical protein